MRLLDIKPGDVYRTNLEGGGDRWIYKDPSRPSSRCDSFISSEDEFMVLKMDSSDSAFLCIQIIGISRELFGWIWLPRNTDTTILTWTKMNP